MLKDTFYDSLKQAPALERIELSEHSHVLNIRLPPHLQLSQAAYQELFDMQPTECGQVQIMGRLLDVPRKQEPFLRGYSFSGVHHKPSRPPPAIVTHLIAFLSGHEALPGFVPNSALINWYRNGQSYIGRHSDDEGQIKQDAHGCSYIATASYGTDRVFRIRCKKTGAIVRDITVSDGHVYVMCGRMQKEFTHEIVKVNGKKGEGVGSRISITLREFK